MPENPTEVASSEDGSSTAYFVQCCDIDVIKNSLHTVLKHIREDQNSSDNTIVLSSRRRLTSLLTVCGYPQFFVSLCREFNLLKNDRVTLLSPMDQLIAIQLCLAEKNKQETGDFDVESSIVIQASKDINNSKLLSNYDITSCSQESGICELYRKFMEECNCIDMCDAFKLVKEACEKDESMRKQLLKKTPVILDAPKSEIDRHMLKYLCEGRQVRAVEVEVPLDCEDNITVTIDDGCLDTLLVEKEVMSTVKKAPSITDAYVRIIYLSYLELLVNSRSELAMSRVFNVPERELTHAAFTDLKHQARQKNMTMYQTATSYIMRIRLGGKGYAPDSSNPLAPHVKGVGEFVSLMHRMETVLEEEPDIRSACKRTVNIVKREMVKCRDSKIRQSSVESVAELLHEQIAAIIDTLDTQIVDTPGKPAASGGSLTSRRARKALRRLLDKLATVDDDMSSLDHLTDIYSSQRTPLRFPSVLSQFRSPMEDLEVTSPGNRFNQSLSQRVLNQSLKKQTPVYAKRYKSTYDWADPAHNVDVTGDDDIMAASQVFILPSKTVVHAGSRLSSGEAQKALEAMLEKDVGTDTSLSDVTNARNQSKHTKKSSDDDNKDNGNKKPGGKKTKPIEEDGKALEAKGNQSKNLKKRALPIDAQSTETSQPEKKKKQDQSKSCRRKLLPQVKGQQQLTSFFRV
ncbi:PCNA-interacting partner-like [Mya arenaria]|uniref:PCNA-interacting partner-like n=1 Tax=Mya arenaria TaxID=6604 RepID=UPI0022E4C554|nr:PCNA-interacting partner-like [Mya arenaria]XP_052776622.1 PCNA-interacting partner-like [Mya arenaria]